MAKLPGGSGARATVRISDLHEIPHPKGKIRMRGECAALIVREATCWLCDVAAGNTDNVAAENTHTWSRENTQNKRLAIQDGEKQSVVSRINIFK
jgi:hypothetical protein